MIAILADIHGNSWALEAVLEEIDRRGVRDIVNLGDCFYGPLDPRRTWELLRDRRWPTIRGNQDRVLISESGSGSPRSRVVGALGPEGLAWIGSVTKAPATFGGMFLCHGTPSRDDEYLLESVTEFGVSLHAPDEVDRLLGEVREPLILCGHSHVPRLVRTGLGRTVVNPGSVGLPAYCDDSPHPHCMEAGSPHARFALVCEREKGWHVELIAVAYDAETAARAAVRNGRRDWSAWLRTGRAQSAHPITAR